jgi:DNA-binding FadR family transcriptional regulator
MSTQGFGSPYAVLRPVRAGNVFEETIEHLLQAIKLGVFPPGQKLPPERELSEHLGVSRATLRDALGELQRAGFLEVQRGRYGGTFVIEPKELESQKSDLDPRDVQDVLLFRAVVEPAAAELAAKADLSASARMHLQTSLSEVQAADLDSYRPRDARFHIAIAELTDSPTLISAVAETRSRVNSLLDRIPLLPVNLEHSNEQHAQIAAAILQGDAEAARAIMSSHIEGTSSLLRGFLS